MPSLNAPTAYALKGNTISTSVIAISAGSWSWGATDLAEADQALICCNTNGVVLTYDGTNPTASLGIALAAGAQMTVKGNANILALKFIRSGGSDATLTVQLEKYS